MKKQMKISAIGDGTTTGAISSLNSNLVSKQSKYGYSYCIYLPQIVNNVNALIHLIKFNFDTDRNFFLEGTFDNPGRHWQSEYAASLFFKHTVDVVFYRQHENPSLFSTNTDVLKPVILKYTNPSDETDTCYYLSLLYTKGDWNHTSIYFNGVTSDDIIGTYIKYTDSLPDGYEIFREPLPMRKLNLVSGYIGNDNTSYSYADIKALEDRISILETR